MIKNGVFIVALVVTSLLGGVCIVAFFGSLPPQPGQTAAEEWVFEKYFEDLGNGVYHVEGRDWLQMSSAFDEKFELDPTKIRTTKESATVLGQWIARHRDRRVVSVVMQDDATFIIVTEPVRR